MAIGGSVLMAAVVFGNDLYNYMKPRRLGIYGPTMVGKTTLDRFMTTPGEMADVEERTTHSERLLGSGHVLPNPTRKRIRYKGEKRVIHSSDLGGQQRFWNLWIDDRAQSGNGSDTIDAVGGLEYLVDALIERRWKYRSLKSRWKGQKYAPKQIWVVANKADTWWDQQANILWQSQRLREHPIFNPYRPAMVKLQKAGIPCRVSMMATKIGWNVEQTLVDMLTW